MHQLRLGFQHCCSTPHPEHPVMVHDPVVLAEVAVLLTGRAVPPGSRSRVRRDGPPGSQSPDGTHPVGVDAAGSGGAGADHGMIQDGGHDLGLAGQVQRGELGLEVVPAQVQ